MKYGSLEQIALALYKDGVLDETVAQEFRLIGHLQEDIAFYLAEMLEHLKAEQLFAVITTEHLNEDIEQVLGVAEPARIHENRSCTSKSQLQLSERARANLGHFLKADFECINKLNSLQALSAEVYSELTT